MIDIEGHGYRLSGKEAPVMFDLDADGWPDRITWTQSDSKMAFLALDWNGSGIIDSGVELFGDRTPLFDGTVAPNGFVALASFDDNADGQIDAQDAIWQHLLLWTDLNHDGFSQESELSSIRDSQVVGIETLYRAVGRRDSHGNTFRLQGKVITSVGTRPVYDVWFISAH